MRIFRLFSASGWPIGPDEEVLLTAPTRSGDREVHLGTFPNRTDARLWLRERREEVERLERQAVR
jgi:hypothetical protein